MSKRAQYDPADYPTRDWADSEQHDTWRQETSRRFHDLMDKAMMVSFYKYGAVADAYPDRVSAVDSLRLRLDAYLNGKRNPDFGEEGESEFLVPPGNAEYLVDVANFAMIEFMHPHITAALIHTDADGSPGRVGTNREIYDKPMQFKNTDIEPAGLP
jgi:hypothetical protein